MAIRQAARVGKTRLQMKHCCAAIVAASFLCLFVGAAFSTPPATADESGVGMNAEVLAKIRTEVDKEIAANNLPGCVVLIGRQGKIFYREAFGNRQVKPTAVPMTVDTVFDLASLTKPIATATTVAALVERGKLRYDDPVAKYIPKFAQQGKENITIEQLLTHQSGLLADNAVVDYADGPEKAFEKICELSLQAEPGTKFIYSDVGFILLGEIVRRVDSRGLAEVSQDFVFRPLGMRETTYLANAELRKRCAPTQQRDGDWMRGEVHDPRAYKLGGVAGHAGLFSTADDLAIYAQMLLDKGRAGDKQVLKSETVQQLTEAVKVPGGLRTRGFDMRTGYSHLSGKGMSESSIGHGGFTGTGIWIDPQRELFVIFLSNRVHPDGKGKANPLIARICTLAVEAVEKRPDSPPR
jgi:CubicO group peptidase (beta-lactamase class C family)